MRSALFSPVCQISTRWWLSAHVGSRIQIQLVYGIVGAFWETKAVYLNLFKSFFTLTLMNAYVCWCSGRSIAKTKPAGFVSYKDKRISKLYGKLQKNCVMLMYYAIELCKTKTGVNKTRGRGLSFFLKTAVLGLGSRLRLGLGLRLGLVSTLTLTLNLTLQQHPL